MSMADEQNPNDITGVEQNHVVAALSYLGILVLIPLLFVGKNDPFIKFHAKQGLVILLGFIVAVFVVRLVPVVGNLLWVMMAIASIAGLIQSLQGHRWSIPVIGTLAERIRI